MGKLGKLGLVVAVVRTKMLPGPSRLNVDLDLVMMMMMMVMRILMMVVVVVVVTVRKGSKSKLGDFSSGSHYASRPINWRDTP